MIFVETLVVDTEPLIDDTKALIEYRNPLIA